MSAFMTGRGANQGGCTQPCRWSYALVEEKRPGEYFPVGRDERGTYIFNSKDLCLVEEMGKLTALGLDAFKIEGRMKGPLYLASTVRSYRLAIDRCRTFPGEFRADPAWIEDLERTSHRPFTKGFLFERFGTATGKVDPTTSYVRSHTLAGLVRTDPPDGSRSSVAVEAFGAEDHICIEVRSRLRAGMTLEFLYPDGGTLAWRLEHFEDLRGNSLSLAQPNTWISLSVPFPTFPLQVVRIAA